MDPDRLAADIQTAWQQRRLLPPLGKGPDCYDLDTGFAVQDRLLDRMLAAGHVMSGAKIGISDPRAFAAFGVTEPVSGLLFEDMRLASGHHLATGNFVAPRAEGELCLTLSADLDNPDMSLEDAARAIASVSPAIEIVDTRWQDWGGALPEMVAENVLASYYVMGDPVAFPGPDRIAAARMQMRVDGELVSEGTAEAAFGSPLAALHWLACRMAKRGRPLKAGHQVMSGAFAPMTPVQSGQTVEVDFPGFGGVTVSFA